MIHPMIRLTSPKKREALRLRNRLPSPRSARLKTKRRSPHPRSPRWSLAKVETSSSVTYHGTSTKSGSDPSLKNSVSFPGCALLPIARVAGQEVSDTLSSSTLLMPLRPTPPKRTSSSTAVN
ncbi:hypothetical protein EMCG_07595 [[Emmonsia] crescens]|uniref:Uncharacterized protein n=1 Tax=[Emmonsia] crescens TaxID=73230 RepID=A0A0G2I8B5_9EURO|nr:hypothetical protein EMCG_07595 [Emmonsia crescens UAMH 3008]